MITKNYPYLSDPDFLGQIVELTNITYYVKISLLTWSEVFIQEIEGRITTANLTINGNSAVRRVGNITFIAQEDDEKVAEFLELNKKIYLQIGYENPSTKYDNFPIIWFPLGLYIITGLSFNKGLNGTSILLNFKDKMCLLNGEFGGVLPAATVFDNYEIQDNKGNIIISHPTIVQIIMELVNHFGGEQIGNIIISDIDSRIKVLMQWDGDGPLYVLKKGDSYYYTINETTALQAVNSSGYIQEKGSPFESGSNVGFTVGDFTYPGDLIGNAGESVVTILDKIKNLLGNYEYFYDLNGHFRFQEIKNYLNNSQSKYIMESLSKGKMLPDYLTGQGVSPYLIQRTKNKAVFSFKEHNNLVISYASTPQIANIKNDFIVWGLRKGTSKNSVPIRYHLAIDSKPKIGNTYNVVKYVDIYNQTLEKWYKPVTYSHYNQLPSRGLEGVIYYITNTHKFFMWKKEDNLMQYVQIADINYQTITTKDWRTQLYFQGIDAQNIGVGSNAYYAELLAEWPKIYDIQNGKFRDQIVADPSQIDYYLDFINPAADKVKKICVDSIGRRTVILNKNNNINCVFEPYIPDVVLINKDYTEDTNSNTDMKQLRNECIAKGWVYTQVEADVYNNLIVGAGLNSGYDEIKQILYQYINNNESITLQTLPIYFLEPNTCIEVYDKQSHIEGNYMINSLNFSLDTSSNLSISASKILERF